MKALFRKVFGPSKRELRRQLESAREYGANLYVKAHEGDAVLCREIERLNDELDALNHQFAPIKFENDRLAYENRELGQFKEKLFADLSRLADENARLRANIERLNDDLAKAETARATLSDQVRDLAASLADAEQEADGLSGYFDNIDNQISAALEKVGAFPGPPAGVADRVDVICERVVSLHAELNAVVATASETNAEYDGLKQSYHSAIASWSIDHNALAATKQALEEADAENKRLTRMLTEPEFLKAESKRVGEIVTMSADLKHWAARVMARSFAASLGDENAVEIELGNEEVGQLIVTIWRRGERTPYEMIEEWRTKVGHLEIALEASAELEKEWKEEKAEYEDRLDRLRRAYRRRKDECKRLMKESQGWFEYGQKQLAEASKYADAYRVATHSGDVAREQLEKLRERCDKLAHALIGLTTAVSDMRDWNSHPGREHLNVLVGRLESAASEADRALGSEPSAA